MTDHIALLLCKMMVGHGRLALIWFCFSEYQKLSHVLSLAYAVRFEVESTDSHKILRDVHDWVYKNDKVVY